jgi:hypothetical protein
MYKFAAIGALIVALAVPTSAFGQRVRPSQAVDRASCLQPLVFRTGRNYAMCGGRFWIRDPQTGQVVAVPFWKLQQPQPGNPDRP